MKPSIGRVLWYWPAGVDYKAEGAQPQPVSICYVHSDSRINVGGFTPNGTHFADTSVLLLNDPNSYGNPAGGSWCQWMPYQHAAQAAQDTKAAS